mgnify:CR=1 FL=1|tara:strand:- start:535 stop:786 length:252 start_codon:yes stop_codon:yes gene_type:complete
MRTFLVQNTRKGTTIKITLHNPPYENQNVLAFTGYSEKDCVITDLSEKNTIDLNDYDSIDNEYDERENSLMGAKHPKKAKRKK